MKLITAIIRPTSLQDVQVALVRHGVSGMTVSECSGYGRQQGHREVYRGTEVRVDFLAKARVEIAVRDEALQGTLDVLVQAASTGEVGDGKVWVTDITEAIRIRTSESGRDAL
ncbi:MAG: P-II family nitrogen regulator [Flaviflexus sp.]|uniref:P-II family nitrogen regulator n=1 Tax=Flaviflexus sp. TaxID=1969482 RepID=UPI00352E4B10